MISTLFESLRRQFRAQRPSTSSIDDIGPLTPLITIPHLLTLPTELIIFIAQFCSTNDIKQLCETCRSLHDACIPELYRVADFSSHNSDVSSDPFGVAYHRVPLDFIRRKWTELDYRVYQKQRKYMRTLDANPALGKYVKEMYWTVLDLVHEDSTSWDDSDFVTKLQEEEGDPYFFKSEYKTDYEESWQDLYHEQVDGDGDCPCERELDGFTQRSQAVWRTFQRFVNVSRVDLCWLRRDREILLPEPKLFPAAKSVSLSGCMTQGLVEIILALSIRQLKALELRNLGQHLVLDPPLPRFTNIPDFAKYWRSHRSHHVPIRNTHLMDCPIDPFLGLTNLTSLTITTTGLHEETRLNSYDDQRYASWAHFIASVRENLIYLAFKQGISRNEAAPIKGSRYRPLPQKHRPMDRLFRQHLLPILLEAPWPRIQRMEIRGVGRYIRQGSWNQAPTEEQRRAEPDVEYDVRPEVFSAISPNQRLGYYVTKTRVAFPEADQQVLLGLLPDSAELVVEETPERDYEDFDHYDEYAKIHGFEDDCTCRF